MRDLKAEGKLIRTWSSFNSKGRKKKKWHLEGFKKRMRSS